MGVYDFEPGLLDHAPKPKRLAPYLSGPEVTPSAWRVVILQGIILVTAAVIVFVAAMILHARPSHAGEGDVAPPAIYAIEARIVSHDKVVFRALYKETGPENNGVKHFADKASCDEFAQHDVTFKSHIMDLAQLVAPVVEEDPQAQLQLFCAVDDSGQSL